MVVTGTDYTELELSFKQHNDPKQYLLDYNVSANSFRGFPYRTKGKFPSQKTGVTYKAGNSEYAITKLP